MTVRIVATVCAILIIRDGRSSRRSQRSWKWFAARQRRTCAATRDRGEHHAARVPISQRVIVIVACVIVIVITHLQLDVSRYPKISIATVRGFFTNQFQLSDCSNLPLVRVLCVIDMITLEQIYYQVITNIFPFFFFLYNQTCSHKIFDKILVVLSNFLTSD